MCPVEMQLDPGGTPDSSWAAGSALSSTAGLEWPPRTVFVGSLACVSAEQLWRRNELLSAYLRTLQSENGGSILCCLLRCGLTM